MRHYFSWPRNAATASICGLVKMMRGHLARVRFPLVADRKTTPQKVVFRRPLYPHHEKVRPIPKTSAVVQVFGCLHDGAVHTRQQQASEKRRGTKSRGARQYGGSNLTAGYGDLKGAPVAASARHIGASGCFGRPWSRNGRATTARKPPAGVHGGDLELLGSLLWRAPAWPVRAQRQSRPVLRLGNGDDGVMTCRSKLAPRRAAGIWAWRRERRPR